MKRSLVTELERGLLAVFILVASWTIPPLNPAFKEVSGYETQRISPDEPWENLILLMNFDENDTDTDPVKPPLTCYDLSPNRNHGTLVLGTNPPNSNLWLDIRTANAVRGRALNFISTYWNLIPNDTRVEIPLIEDLKLHPSPTPLITEYNIEMWIFWNTTGTGGNTEDPLNMDSVLICNMWHTKNNNKWRHWGWYRLGVNNNGTLQVDLPTEGGGYGSVYTFNGSLPRWEWCRINVIISCTEGYNLGGEYEERADVSFYINGIYFGGGTVHKLDLGVPAGETPPSHMYLRCDPNDQHNPHPFMGIMDELRISSRMLGDPFIPVGHYIIGRCVAFYDFDEGGGNKVFSQNTFYMPNPSAATGYLSDPSPYWTPSGRYGWGLLWNHTYTQQYVSIPFFDWMNVYNTLNRRVMIEAWIYPTYAPSASDFFNIVVAKVYMRFGGAVFYYSWALKYHSNRTLSFEVTVHEVTFSGDPVSNTTRTFSVYSTDAIPLNAWTHVAGSFSSMELAIYVNGLRDNGVSLPTPSNPLNRWEILYNEEEPMMIGSDNTTQFFHKFFGIIDQVGIYDYVKELKPAVVEYGFEGSGGTAHDSSPYQNDGLIVGASRNSSGKFGKCLVFDGNNDYVQIGASNSTELEGRFSVDVWIRPEAVEDEMVIVSQRGNGGNVLWKMSVVYQDTMHYAAFAVRNGSGEMLTVISPIPLIEPAGHDSWHHVMGVLTRKQVMIYVDGVCVPSGEEGVVTLRLPRGFTFSPSSEDIYIGAMEAPNGSLSGFFIVVSWTVSG